MSTIQKIRKNGSGFLITLFLIICLLIISYVIKEHTNLFSKANVSTESSGVNSTFQIGFNIPGIINYGDCDGKDPFTCNDILPYATKADGDAALLEMNKMGATIVRVFAANKYITDTEAARRLDDFLTRASAYNISVIVSFINYYGDSGYYPEGTEQFYTERWNNIPLLNATFFNLGYKDRYLSFVNTVVNRNKYHQNIYAWEPGNELPFYSSFYNDVAQAIKTIDPEHMITSGSINPVDVSTPLDMDTVHLYWGPSLEPPPLVLGLRPLIIEEYGYDSKLDRTSEIRKALDLWRNQGIKAAVFWGFIAKGVHDTGDGDNKYGMDTLWHCADYNQLFNLFQEYSGVPITTPSPLPSTCMLNIPTNTKIYVDPSPVILGENAVVTATGSKDCSTNIVKKTGNGLSNCTTMGGFTCQSANSKDNNPCFWQWTCGTTTIGNFTATFAAANNASCNSSLDYKVTNQTSTPTTTLAPSSTLTPFPTFVFYLEDINRDGCIDILDFNLWLRAFKSGSPDTDTYPDVNLDGVIDIQDFNLWFKAFKNFNQSC